MVGGDRYSYKSYPDGSVAVYKDRMWQCVIDEGIERAKEIFEKDNNIKDVKIDDSDT